MGNISADKMTDEQKAAVATVAPQGNLPAYLQPFPRSPALVQPTKALADYLNRRTGALPPKLLQLPILMISKQWMYTGAWNEHAGFAARDGMNPEIIQAIKEGRRPNNMAPDEQALYDFCAELQKTMGVSDATYARAVATFGERRRRHRRDHGLLYLSRDVQQRDAPAPASWAAAFTPRVAIGPDATDVNDGARNNPSMNWRRRARAARGWGDERSGSRQSTSVRRPWPPTVPPERSPCGHARIARRLPVQARSGRPTTHSATFLSGCRGRAVAVPVSDPTISVRPLRASAPVGAHGRLSRQTGDGGDRGGPACGGRNRQRPGGRSIGSAERIDDPVAIRRNHQVVDDRTAGGAGPDKGGGRRRHRKHRPPPLTPSPRRGQRPAGRWRVVLRERRDDDVTGRHRVVGY